MELQFEKRLPSSLNFVLICRDLGSPASLRIYLESKTCVVVQQDDIIVALGTTTPFTPREELRVQESSGDMLPVTRETEIHAYLRSPLNWKNDWSHALHGSSTRMQRCGGRGERPKDDDYLCLAFVTALNPETSAGPTSHRFFEEALVQVREAYLHHARRSAYADTPPEPEEAKPARESLYLTAREHEILKWVSEGKGCWETGAILGISERTVKFHLQNIYRKLNVVNRAQAITKAMRYALI